jgi:hypothetical protein
MKPEENGSQRLGHVNKKERSTVWSAALISAGNTARRYATPLAVPVWRKGLFGVLAPCRLFTLETELGSDRAGGDVLRTDPTPDKAINSCVYLGSESVDDA